MKINLHINIDDLKTSEGRLKHNALEHVLPIVDIKTIKNILLNLQNNHIIKRHRKYFFSILQNEKLIQYNLFESFYFLLKNFISKDELYQAIKYAPLDVLQNLCNDEDIWFGGQAGVSLLCGVLRNKNISKELFYKYEHWGDYCGYIQEVFEENKGRFNEKMEEFLL